MGTIAKGHGQGVPTVKSESEVGRISCELRKLACLVASLRHPLDECEQHRSLNPEPESLMKEIAEFLISKTCDDHRKFGGCGCISRHGVNPCETTANIAKDALHRQNLHGVLKRVAIHKCANAGNCQHKGCIKTALIEQKLM